MDEFRVNSPMALLSRLFSPVLGSLANPARGTVLAANLDAVPAAPALCIWSMNISKVHPIPPAMKRLQLALTMCCWNSKSIYPYICIYSPLIHMLLMCINIFLLFGKTGPPHHPSCLRTFGSSLSSEGCHFGATPETSLELKIDPVCSCGRLTLRWVFMGDRSGGTGGEGWRRERERVGKKTGRCI